MYQQILLLWHCQYLLPTGHHAYKYNEYAFLQTSNVHIVNILEEAASVIIETSESQATHFIDRQCLCEEKAKITEWQETRIHNTVLVTAQL